MNLNSLQNFDLYKNKKTKSRLFNKSHLKAWYPLNSNLKDISGNNQIDLYSPNTLNYILINPTESSVFLPESVKIFSALQSSGYTANSLEKEAIDSFVYSGIKYGWWDKMVGLYGLLGGTNSTTKINWKSPGTHNMTWTSSGIAFDAYGVHATSTSGGGSMTGITYGPSSVLWANDINLSYFCYQHISSGGNVMSSYGNFGDSHWANSGIVMTEGSNNLNLSVGASFGFITTLSPGVSRTGKLITLRRFENLFSVLYDTTSVYSLNTSTFSSTSLSGYNIDVIKMRDRTEATSYSKVGLFSAGHYLTDSELSSFKDATSALMKELGRLA